MPTQARIRYGVAMSLDGYIAGPHGEADWIIHDSEIDFAEIWAQFGTLLLGRRTYQAAVARLGETVFRGPRTVVASRTLRPEDHPHISVLQDVTKEQLHTLRRQEKKDIWLMGGSELAASVFELDEVDGLDLSIIPVLLGAGVPLSARLATRTRLTLLSQQTYRSGIVRLEYAVKR